MKKNENPNVWRYWPSSTGNWNLYDDTNEAIIVIVLRGQMTLTMGCNQLELTGGEMFLKPPGIACKGQIQEKTHLISCRFSPPNLLTTYLMQDVLQAGCTHAPTAPVVLKSHGTFNRFLELLEYYLIIDFTIKELWEIKRKEFFCLLLTTYNQKLLATFLYPIIDDKVDFHHFVANNWLRARNVEELAAIAYLSTSGFTKKFRRYFHESPYKWMIHQRAEWVIKDMAGGSISIKEIIDKYHFSGYAHFGQFCRTHYGVSPKELVDNRKKIALLVKTLKIK